MADTEDVARVLFKFVFDTNKEPEQVYDFDVDETLERLEMLVIKYRIDILEARKLYRQHVQ